MHVSFCLFFWRWVWVEVLVEVVGLIWVESLMSRVDEVEVEVEGRDVEIQEVMLYLDMIRDRSRRSICVRVYVFFQAPFWPCSFPLLFATRFVSF